MDFKGCFLGCLVSVFMTVCVHSADFTIDVTTTERTPLVVGADLALLYCDYTITPQPDESTSVSVDWNRGISLMARVTVGGLSPIVQSSDPDKYGIINGSSLKIFNVDSEDAGTYTCLVTVTPTGGQESVRESSNTELRVLDENGNILTTPDPVGGAVYNLATKSILIIAATTLLLITVF
ncbi:uncharacterized protein LOC144440363 [Glandiceps talaboti]